MKWFNKSSCESIASHHNNIVQQRHKRIKKTTKIPTIKCTQLSEDYSYMTTSLSGVDYNKIQILDPEDFFEDPIHVKNYHKEEQFLNLMSEWEIIENSAALSGNYFSADFEEELLQLRTQSSQIATPSLSYQSYSNDDHYTTATTAEINSNCKTPLSSTSSSTTSLCSAAYLSFQENASPCPTDSSELSELRLIEILFADKIQLGIIKPKFVKYDDNNGKNSLRHSRKRKFNNDNRKNSCVHDLDSNLAQNCSDGYKIFAQPKCSLTCHDLINCSQSKDGALPNSIGMYPSEGIDLEKKTTKDCNYSCGETTCNCDHYDIKKHYNLDDEGNILLNINHIVEFRGFGFAVAQNKRLYKHCLKHTQNALDIDCCERNCLFIMRRSLTMLWNLISGHPRNKVKTHGGGPGDAIRSYTLELGQDHTSTFSRNIENFISCTKESREAAPQVVMRNMRQFMNGMKNYLVKHGEGKFLQEVETARSQLKSDEFLNIDAILETVMHQLVVLPLREHLYGMFVDYYTRSEDIQLLAQNVKYACGRCAADFGIRNAVSPPSCASLAAISNLLLCLQEAELPLEKLDIFLSVISKIVNATCYPRGQQLGADDFLPILVYVVAKCGFVGAEIEAEFMWGLLQPQLLNGEPGYYLTAMISAVHVLKSFMASENESGNGSLDWRSSSLPACSSVLRVIIPDECNGSLQTRTLPVRPHTTTREVCRIIAHKARITNPQDFALFKLVDGEETLLSDLECPQDIRLAAKGKHCMLAYKRIEAKIAWPTATQPNFN